MVNTGRIETEKGERPGGLQRSVGFYGLMFVSLGSIIGSGWLLGALNAAQVAGPASILKAGLSVNAFWKRKQIVVPLAIGMGADIRAVSAVHDSYFGTLSAPNRIERVRLVLDRRNNLLPRPLPTVTSEVGNGLVGTLTIRLANTFHLNISHAECPFWKERPRRSAESLIFFEGPARITVFKT